MMRIACLTPAMICLGFAIVCADEPTAKVETPTPATVATAAAPKSKQRVIRLLQQTAEALRSRSIEPAERPLFAELLAAADDLAKDSTVAVDEREKWRGIARARLAQAAEVLRLQTAKQSAVQVPAAKPSAAVRLPRASILAQVPAGPATATNPPADVVEARALIDLITGAIRPESWEDRGGQGVVRYWSIGHALVIRNTADIQEKIGGTVGQLRK